MTCNFSKLDLNNYSIITKEVFELLQRTIEDDQYLEKKEAQIIQLLIELENQLDKAVEFVDSARTISSPTIKVSFGVISPIINLVLPEEHKLLTAKEIEATFKEMCVTMIESIEV